VLASGTTRRGSRLAREPSLTGSPYVPRSGAEPPDSKGDRSICALLEILAENPRIAALLERDLERHRLTLPELVRRLASAATGSLPSDA